MLEIKIGNKLAEYRRERGFTQYQLAKEVGLKRRSIMAYEAGIISPTIETAYKISYILKKDIKKLFFVHTDDRLETEEQKIIK